MVQTVSQSPTEADARLAAASSPALARLLAEPGASVRFGVPDGDGPAAVLELPAAALRPLLDILRQLARGNGVAVLPLYAQLTTHQAADVLNVDEPFLVGLLDKGDIPSRHAGPRRRVALADVLEYQRKNHEARLAALAELTAIDQELGLGY